MTEKAKNIACLICDLDGVLTDGRIYLGHDGGELKSFCVQDGVGLKLIMQVGITVAVITGSRKSILLKTRMKQLGIEHYFCEQVNKMTAFEQLKTHLQLEDAQCAYIGDDLPDLSIMQRVGFSVAVANAVPQVKAIADYRTERFGGNGAIREVCDIILNAQDKFQQALTSYLHS